MTLKLKQAAGGIDVEALRAKTARQRAPRPAPALPPVPVGGERRVIKRRCGPGNMAGAPAAVR